MVSSRPRDSENLAVLLPPDLHGWKPEKPDGIYTADTLFDLIDGGAEVYRSLNVCAVLSRRYTKTGAPDIIVDIFDMGSSRDAFGAYHHDMREGDDAGVGQESEFLGSNLSFWKDRYFISLIALDETEETGKALMDLSKRVENKIPSKGAVPDLVKLLPQRGLIARQVHYFHDKMLLDHYYFFPEENLLHLDRQTEGVIARYKSKVSPKNNKNIPPSILLLVRYPSLEKAQKAHRHFMERCLPEAGHGGSLCKKNGLWTGAILMENLFVSVLDTPTEKEILRLLQEVEEAHHQLGPVRKE